MPLSDRTRHFILLGCFFLSGAAALVFEVLWVRQLTLLLGHTTLAVSVVLAAFMAGLAIGSGWGGFLCDRISPRRLIFLYALLELGIGILGWSSHYFIHSAGYLLAKTGVWESTLIIQNLLWFFVCFLILIGPAILMGATLPLITRWFTLTSESKDGSVMVGLLYGANTLGAVLGTAMAGFYLIPSLGLSTCYWLAGGMNVLSGGAAGLIYFIDRKARLFQTKPSQTNEDRMTLPPFAPTPQDKTLALTLFITGAAAMICQVAWTRLFSLVIGSSTYAFSIMLLTFLLGLAMGSLCFKGTKILFEPTAGGLSFLMILIGLGILTYLPMFNKLPYYFIKLFPLTSQGLTVLHAVQFSLCAFVMFFPTFFMGMILPWILSVLNAQPARIGSALGLCYAANTVGAILGSVAAGLILIPFWGAERSIVIASLLYAVAGGLICLMNSDLTPARRIQFTGLIALLFSAGLILRPPLDPLVISSGSFLYAPEYRKDITYAAFVRDVHENGLLFHADGLSSTVTVLESSWGGRFLRVNGKTDASSSRDVMTQMMLGYLPAFVHPGQPKNALVIGLGSGMSAGALSLDKNLQQIDCVEIEPAIEKAAAFFSDINHNILNDPRLRIIHTDARHYLQASPKKYDLIISEPSNPWIAGVANLFTREAFNSAKEKLQPDGIFCQWFHSYSMSYADFKMVMNTFADVFPHVLLFTTGDNDYFLIGSNEPWEIDYRKIDHQIASNDAMKRDLTTIGIAHPFTLLATTFMLDDKDFRRFSAGAPLHTDDHPTLEFSAPRYLHRGEDRQILDSLMASKKEFLPTNLSGIDTSDDQMALLYNMAGEAFMRLRHLPNAEKAFGLAMKLNSASARTWVNSGRVHNMRSEHLQAEKAFKKAISLDSGYALAWFHLGMLYLEQGLEKNGIDSLEEGLKRAPGDPMGSLQLGLLYARKGNLSHAMNIVESALRRPIFNSDLYLHLVQLRDSIRQQSKSVSTPVTAL